MNRQRTMIVGNAIIHIWHENFKYYQPNKHICGDCVIRAVSKALDCTWEESFKILTDRALKIKDVPNCRKTVTSVLKDYGFRWVAIKVEKGMKRPTVSEFAKSHDGTYVLKVAHHEVCVKGGKYYDIWDCGEKAVYGYWEKNKTK